MVEARMGKIVLFARIREVLRIPTQLATFLATRAGTIIRRIRPGRVEVDLSPNTSVSVQVRLINPYELEEMAYLINGKPVPPRVLEDSARWKKEHGV